MRRESARGFTLIELLVVIAIMRSWPPSVPGLCESTREARQTSCLNNVKQITLGMLVVSDYDGIPQGDAAAWGDGSYPNRPYGGFADGIYPYVKDNQISSVPVTVWSLPQPRQLRKPPSMPTAWWTKVKLSYGYNYGLYGYSESMVPRPAELALFADMIERPQFYSDGKLLPSGDAAFPRAR